MQAHRVGHPEDPCVGASNGSDGPEGGRESGSIPTTGGRRTPRTVLVVMEFISVFDGSSPSKTLSLYSSSGLKPPNASILWHGIAHTRSLSLAVFAERCRRNLSGLGRI